MTPLQIRAEIEALRHATRPEQRTSYERALLALAAMVDQTTSTLDSLARRLMTAPQLDLINDLRAAVPSTAEHPDPQLEDLFAGTLELTASELAYLRHALAELYMRGGWCPKGENRRDFAKRVNAKLGALKLDRMVTPDGSRLVSVEEHTAIVAELTRERT